MNDTRKTEITKLIESYRRAALGSGDERASDANKSVDHLHAVYKILRTTRDGQLAILSLVDDENPNVRLWAASHSLLWFPDRARPVLEAAVRNGGLLGFTAEMTLKEFDAGRLSFDY